ncbi:S8 family serine peptidase, partial [bacterium]|nr:S8 family serine peptidase [bacterium]
HAIPALAAKTPVSRADDLPRHVYAIDGTATDVVQSDGKFAALASAIRADLEADLEHYDIRDATTLEGIQSTLLALDLMDGDWDAAEARIAMLRDLEDKEAKRLTVGIGAQARITAARAVGLEDFDAFRAVFREEYDRSIRALPWDKVQDVLQGTKSQLEMVSEGLLLGILKERIEPVVAESGELSGAFAGTLVGFRSMFTFGLRVRDDMVAVLQRVVDENRSEKRDIWPARSLDLTHEDGLADVLVAVWDTGVDTDVFGRQVFVNPDERFDGTDTDGNGFVDDVHGIAHDLHSLPTTGELYPMDEATRPIPELQDWAKGLFDMRAAQDTPEARALRTRFSSLGPDDVKPFLEDLTRYSLYAHGTHVAGIALAENPAARVLVSRLTADPRMLGEAPTLENARNMATSVRNSVRYYKEHGVRVVNMSWVVARSSFEHDLEQHGIGESPEERKAMAREMFGTIATALEESFRDAPGILFVGGAGNSDNDIEFDEFVPPMLRLPNLLIAGAVDQAGEATTFTSFGPTVNVYSNGFEVESTVPGGDRLAFSGTSMASPNVVNLAAKLIAIDPSLTPEEVVRLILDGADEVREGDEILRVIHPARSADLLERRLNRS